MAPDGGPGGDLLKFYIMFLYELLIRGKEDGLLSGAHVIEWENGKPGLPRTVKEADWPEVASAVNALVLEENEALKQAAQKAEEEKQAAVAELEETREFSAGIISQAREVLEDHTVSEEERTGLLKSLVEAAALPAKERERLKLEKQRAELEAKLAEM